MIRFPGCRWGLMTLTTVGYDLNPETLLGKIIGGCCALSGVFILTLPIPIVVNSFATYYKNRSNTPRHVSDVRQFSEQRLEERRLLFYYYSALIHIEK